MGAIISYAVKTVGSAYQTVGSACQGLYRAIWNFFSEVWAFIQKLFRRHNTGNSSTKNDFMEMSTKDFNKGSIQNFMVNSMGGSTQNFPEEFMEEFKVKLMKKFTDLMSKCMDVELMPKCMPMSMEEFVKLMEMLIEPTSTETKNKPKFKVADKGTKLRGRKNETKRKKNKK